MQESSTLMNFKISYIRKLVFHLIFKINKWTHEYIEQIYFEEKCNRDKYWDKKFIDTSYFIHDLSHGLKIKLYKNSVLSKLIYEGFEQSELKYLESSLTDGDIFIDVGANIGIFSLYASRFVGQLGKVISIEPSRVTFERLLENVKLNQLGNVSPFNIGLSNRSGRLDLQVSVSGFDAWNTFSTAHNNKFQSKINVQVETLDDLVQNFEKKKIRLIKIDVEGWEKFVLLGGINFLNTYSPSLMVEFTEENTFDAGYLVHELFDILELIGYKWYKIVNGQLVPEIKKIHYPYENLVAKKLI
jgi:FkbM family methyltransferase